MPGERNLTQNPKAPDTMLTSLGDVDELGRYVDELVRSLLNLGRHDVKRTVVGFYSSFSTVSEHISSDTPLQTRPEKLKLCQNHLLAGSLCGLDGDKNGPQEAELLPILRFGETVVL